MNKFVHTLSFYIHTHTRNTDVHIHIHVHSHISIYIGAALRQKARTREARGRSVCLPEDSEARNVRMVDNTVAREIMCQICNEHKHETAHADTEELVCERFYGICILRAL